MKKGTIELALSEMNSRHQRLAAIFSPEVFQSRGFKREQIRELTELLRSQPAKTLDKTDRFHRKLVKQQRNELVKKLYPNVYFRLLRNLTSLLFSIVTLPVRTALRFRQNVQLNKELRNLNASETSQDVRRKMNAGLSKFTAKQDKEISDGSKLTYQFKWEHDNGRPGISGVTVSQGSKSAFLTKEFAMIPPESAKNLLEGRAVMVNGNRWLTIDNNDKDATGNNKVKSFVNFDLDKALRSNKLPGLGNALKRADVAQKLQSGEPITLETKGQKVLLTVSPLSKNVVAKDSEGKVLELPKVARKQPTKVVQLESKLNKGMRL